jgi:hypothetical protein
MSLAKSDQGKDIGLTIVWSTQLFPFKYSLRLPLSLFQPSLKPSSLFCRPSGWEPYWFEKYVEEFHYLSDSQLKEANPLFGFGIRFRSGTVICCFQCSFSFRSFTCFAFFIFAPL